MESFIVETTTPVVVYLLVEAESASEAKEIAKAQVERDFKPQYMENDRSYASVKETISRVIGVSGWRLGEKNDEKFYC